MALPFHADLVRVVAFAMASASLLLGGCGGATLVAEPDAIDFGDVLIGSKAERTVSWVNLSTNPAEIQTLRSTGSGAFAVTNEAAATVPLAHTERTPEVIVRFAPDAEGKFTATLNPQTVNGGQVGAVLLNGSGVYARGLEGLDLDTPGRPFTEPFFFGRIPVDRTGGVREIGLHNRTTSDMVIDAAWLRGDQGFTIPGSGSERVVVPAGSRKMLRLRFDPRRPGVFSDSLLMTVEGKPGTAGLVVRGEGLRTP